MIRPTACGGLALAACVSMLGAGSADAQVPPSIRFGLAVGASHPVGEMSFRYTNACDWTALVEFRAPASQLAFRLVGSFSGYGSLETPTRVISAKREILSAGGDVILYSDSTTFQPYFIAGGGLFDVKVWAFRYNSSASPPYTATEDQKAFGWNWGAGVSYPIGSGPRATRAFLEMRYTSVKTRDSDQSDRGLTLIKLMAGITF